MDGEEIVSIKLYAMTCGWLTGDLDRLMGGEEGKAELPIPAYLIEHPRGTALFDTGMHPACQQDPAGRVGPRIAGLFGFNYHPGEEISARLAVLGRDPGRIDLIITSHLHFDHVGGNALIPNATVIVQRREWEAGLDPDIAAQRGFDRQDYDLGHKVLQVDGEHDVFGDGSVVCLPTYGHTPGHQSLKVFLWARSCWLPMLAISAAPYASGDCRNTCTTAGRCTPRSTASPSSKRAAPVSSSATTATSGRRCRRRPRRSASSGSGGPSGL